tara:strand:+ start:2320 stop:3435 length:1116 start_codon:yes stop_codon:yes gene_type:complete
VPKKIVYILSEINRSVAFEWVVKNLDQQKITLSFILINCTNSHIEKFLKEEGIKTQSLRFKAKWEIPISILKVVFILLKIRPQIVHTHLRDASLIGQIAAWITRIEKRIYTRHHSTFHQKYFPKAVWLDRLNNYLATNIVAISGVVQQAILNEGGDPKKITKAYYGFDFSDFGNVTDSRIRGLRKKYAIREGVYPIIGVISRYINWKGHQYMLPAFKEVLRVYPNALLIIANASGSYRNEIKEILADIPKENILEISFEKDLFALYKLFDVFVHCPIDESIEAFGQVYVEALAAKIPSVFTLSGIANEFIVNGENGLVVPHQKTLEIANAIKLLLENETLRQTLINNGVESVKQFSVLRFINELELLYKIK